MSYSQGPLPARIATMSSNTAPSFELQQSHTGMLSASFTGYSESIQGMALQPDGRIVAVGFSHLDAMGARSDISVMRFNADGTLDPRFGAGGKFALDTGNDFDYAHAVALQPDGRIVLAGGTIKGDASPPYLGYDYNLVRLDRSGSLDASFDNDGWSLIDFQ